MKLNYILATAGHVDHGKSSLVKALTGIDPDRLPEEKARGITIDLGFAHLTLPAVSGEAQPATQIPEPDTYNLGIVDVPGHEDFVKNMVAGVGTVVTGTLTGGTLSRGQAVVASPSGKATRIRSLQSHNCEVEASGPGTRTALNLPDVSVAGKSAHAAGADGVRRGEVVTLAEL